MFNDTLTDAQRAAITEYAKVRRDLLDNLGNNALNVEQIKRIANALPELGITLTRNDSVCGVRANTATHSAMFEWNYWEDKLHFFRERGAT